MSRRALLAALASTTLASTMLAGCTTIRVTDHVAAPGPEAPRRILVVNRLGGTGPTGLAPAFAAAFSGVLSRCGVAVRSSVPDSMELDGEAKFRSLLKDFQPDAVMTVRQIESINGAPNSGTFLFTLRDVVRNKDVWRGSVLISTGSREEVVQAAAQKLAEELVRTLAADNVLKSCASAVTTVRS